MNSYYYQRSVDILNQLGDDARYWGRVVDEFLDCVGRLTVEESTALRTHTSASIRYALMCQYLSHFQRIRKDCTMSDLKIMIQKALILICLENYEYDYRETILLVQLFVKQAKDSSSHAIVKDVWSEIKPTAPSRAVWHLGKVILLGTAES